MPTHNTTKSSSKVFAFFMEECVITFLFADQATVPQLVFFNKLLKELQHLRKLGICLVNILRNCNTPTYLNIVNSCYSINAE
jgi:hypothetical protein